MAVDTMINEGNDLGKIVKAALKSKVVFNINARI